MRQLAMPVLLCFLLYGSIRNPRPLFAAAPKVITNSVGMKLVLIPAGEFDMGAPPSESGSVCERPVHHVRITKPFYLAQYETTLGDFLAFCNDASYKSDAEAKGGEGYVPTTGCFASVGTGK